MKMTNQGHEKEDYADNMSLICIIKYENKKRKTQTLSKAILPITVVFIFINLTL